MLDLFSLFGRHYLWAPTCNVGPASPGWIAIGKSDFQGAIFFVFICTSKLQVFQLSVQFVRIFFFSSFFFPLCSSHILPFTLFRRINNGLECTASCKLSLFHSTLSREKKINKGHPQPPKIGKHLYLWHGWSLWNTYDSYTLFFYYYFKKGRKKSKTKNCAD